ncbi:hypothetical protein PYW07_009127 [Mythimna separata]|uniref:apyrase n=1 Tax=Mythimna separata TaxID=271217 RepID=A0AAD8DMX5_MYTSE|nr:hypothetical protein PYW07_009127 [Mythimna separata]
MFRLLLIFSYVVLLSSCAESVTEYDLNILHYNDFHARFVETSPTGLACNPSASPCIGGFARLVTLVRERLSSEPDSLLLNAGDSFQGTIWYNILRWNVTKDFMNMLPHDAHTLGNHEFDHGVEGLVPYLKNLDSKVVTANIIDDDEPTMHGLYEKSIVVEKNGRKIGIIGVLIATTNILASTGRLKFTDEVQAVKEEAEKLNAAGVDIIIVLSHCGLDIDKKIALEAGPHIDIIVGGHSHTLLFNGQVPDNSGFTPYGPYPVVVDQTSRKVLIVQAAAFTQYLGEIKITFNETGHLLRWTGNPHYIGNEIEQAPDVLEKINEYLPGIEEKANEKIGITLVELSSNCTCSECNFGNFICDAFMFAALHKAGPETWNYAHFCAINRGSIRATIEEGVITYESVMVSNPFENNVEVFDLKGEHVLEMLEFAVTNDPWPGAKMIQVSGLRATFDGSLPVNSRVLNVTVRCIECDVPRYEPLELDKYYKVVSQSFIANGGDGFTMISENRKNVEVLGVDYDLLMEYIRHQSPIIVDTDGRITISNACQSTDV